MPVDVLRNGKKKMKTNCQICKPPTEWVFSPILSPRFPVHTQLRTAPTSALSGTHITLGAATTVRSC